MSLINQKKLIEEYKADMIGEYILVMREKNGRITVWQSSDDILFSDLATGKRFIGWSEEGYNYLGEDFERKELVCSHEYAVSVPRSKLWIESDLSVLTKDVLKNLGVESEENDELLSDVYSSNNVNSYLAVRMLKSELF